MSSPKELTISESFYALKSVPRLPEASSIVYAAADDATKAFFVPLQALASGKNGVLSPFRHDFYLGAACQVLYKALGDERLSTMAQQFELKDNFAQLRNMRLMRKKFNPRLNKKRLPTFTFRPEDQALNDRLQEFKSMAVELGVDVTGYFDLSYDSDDFAGCNNAFCLTPKKAIGVAGDKVTIVRDLDNEFHVLMIVRANSPGKRQLALPGGFKEGKETAMQMCKREDMEESGYASTGLATGFIMLPQVVSFTWDPRPLFAEHGMCNEGLLQFDDAMQETSCFGPIALE